jgi:membrane protease YdiL (CAAX protease family)
LTKPRIFYDADGRLRTLWRVLAFLAMAIVFAALCAGLLVGIIGRGEGIREVVLVSWAIVLGFVLAHLVMVRAIDPQPWSDLGLGSEQARPRYAILGILVGALSIAVPMALLLGVRWLHIRPAPEGSSIAFALAALALFIPAAFLEELLLRGYMFRVLKDSWGWIPTLIFTSVIFAVMHWFNPNGCVSTWRAGEFDLQTCIQSTTMVTLAGIFLGGILVFTGSLYAAWAAHFAWNWMMTGVLHAPVSGQSGVPGVPTPDFTVVDAGPDVVTGGPWGPEGGLAAAIGMVVTFLILWWYWKRRQRTEAAT